MIPGDADNHHTSMHGPKFRDAYSVLVYQPRVKAAHDGGAIVGIGFREIKRRPRRTKCEGEDI